MKRLLLGSLAAISLIGTGAASAADLGRPAPAPVYTKAPVVAPFSWTGFYLGADAGYAWARDRDTETVLATGAPSVFSPTSAAQLKGFKAGGYLGYNWQISAFVFGVEADAEYAHLTGQATFPNTAPADFYEGRIRNEESVRGRIGYAMNNALFYATGGVAFASITEHDVSVSGGRGAFDTSSSRTGWTAGAGIDYAFTRNWIGRVEYRYADFGNFSYTSPAFPAFVETHKITENVVRGGIAYKFGY
jgi:outer membrane immunogenic protein